MYRVHEALVDATLALPPERAQGLIMLSDNCVPVKPLDDLLRSVNRAESLLYFSSKNLLKASQWGYRSRTLLQAHQAVEFGKDYGQSHPDVDTCCKGRTVTHSVRGEKTHGAQDELSWSLLL